MTTSTNIISIYKFPYKKIILRAVIGLSIIMAFYFFSKNLLKLDNEIFDFIAILLAVIYWRMNSKIPLILASFLIMFIPIFQLITYTILPSFEQFWAEKAAVWAFYLLTIGTIRLFTEHYTLNKKTSKNITYIQLSTTSANPFSSQTDGNSPTSQNSVPIVVTSAKKKWLTVYFLVTAFISFLAGCISFEGIYLVTQNKNNIPQTFSPTPTATSPISKTPSITPTMTVSKEPDLSAYTIRILNGSGIAGEAARLKATLTLEKFKVGTIGNADRSNYQNTQITANKSVNKEYINKLKEILDKTYRTNVESQVPETASQEADVVITIGKAVAK